MGVSPIKPSNRFNVNDEIRAKEVRLVKEDGEQLGVVDIKTALATARELNLDLVEIVADAKPPVAKIMDYKRYLYEQKQKAKEAKKIKNKPKSKKLNSDQAPKKPTIKSNCVKLLSFWKKKTKLKFLFVFVGVKWHTKKLDLNN